MSVRVLQLGDVHLGAPLENFGEYAPRRREEHAAAFRAVIEIAIKEKVHAVLFTGDLFDTARPGADTVNLARRELGRLEQAGIQVFGVPGTHDSLAYSNSVYRTESLPFQRLFTGPTFDDPAELEVDGIRIVIYGMAYDPEVPGSGWGSLQRIREGGVHIALAHAACRFNPEWPISPEDLPFEEEDLAGMGMDYIALGHYHNLRLFEDGDGVVGAYSGSILGRDWTEPGPRHVLVVEWERDGGRPEVRPVVVPTRFLDSEEVDVSGATDREGMVVAIETVCEPETLWRVTLTGEPEIVPRSADLEAILEAKFEHVRIVDETTLVASDLLARRCEEETVRGEFFRRLLDVREQGGSDRDREVADRAIKLGLRVFG